MLTRIKESEIEKLEEALSADPVFNVRLSALVRAYGTGHPFFNVWRQEWDVVLARLESSFFIYAGENADFEEIAFFLQFNPYFRRLAGKSQILKQVTSFLGDGYELCDFDCMVYREKVKNQPAQCVIIDSEPDLKSVYEVMKSTESADFTVGEFMPWYADVSHRIRHGCARAYLLRVNSEPVSVCLVSAQSDGAGLISGVATKSNFRGRGYAAALTSKVCFDLKTCGKLPVLECLPFLADYYVRVGFEKIDTVTVIDIK
jgi:ribosomal protein S18 acetylase RimI-like enzyme